ncbi:MAG: type II CRISPR RNA-guided endonuclease Cas9 [Neisseriaceae bacterium]|nr:type II CRISPR RNA-guided endonuclease Cas9 [Neisseriaceae bacterium]
MAKQDYIIGLDLGIASVGWACVKVAVHTDENGKEQAQPMGLIDCGVRCFAAAEEPKTGESLNAARRAARSQRRTIARRANRMRQVRKLLFKHGLLTANEFQAAYCQNPKHKKDKDTTLIKERNEKLLKKIGIPEQQLLSGSLKNNEKAFFSNVWQLRVEALHRKLERAEFAAVICHLVKHRGYRSTRKSERKNNPKDDGMLAGIQKNSDELAKRKEDYTPAKLAVETFKNDKGQPQYRNKAGAYIHTFDRLHTKAELELIFKKQKEFENEFAKDELCKQLAYLLWYQKDAIKSQDIVRKVGYCTHEREELTGEKSEKRAPKHCYSSERFVWISKLNNLKIKENGRERSLTENERNLIRELPFELNKLSFSQVRKKLEELLENATFNLCRYPHKNDMQKLIDTAFKALYQGVKKYPKIKDKFNNELKDKKDNVLNEIENILFSNKGNQEKILQKLLQYQPYFSVDEINAIANIELPDDTKKIQEAEEATLFEAKFFHEIRNEYKNAQLIDEWEQLKNNPNALDRVGCILSTCKTDDEIRKKIKDNNDEYLPYSEYAFSEKEIRAILECKTFDKFLNLSLKCMRKLLSEMEKKDENGNFLTYDKACKNIYGNHYGRSKNKQAFDKLPPIDKKDPDTPNNPVVYRTITQARKIINALIAQYGQPFRVHIEMTRELGKSRKDRDAITKQQDKNKEERKDAIKLFKETFTNYAGEPKGKDILKFRLYEQQYGKCLYCQDDKPKGQCVYCGDTLDTHRLFEKGYVEIDHAIPFSRSWDDSQNNKVLACGKCNQEKGNKTPFEWFGHDIERWRKFEARVNACRFSLRKKQNILRRELDDKEFIERNINDTRYATRFLLNYIENKLSFSGSLKYTDKQGVEHFAKKVFAPQGQITSLLRNSWGFAKVREDNDRHHALDAIIVACTTESMQQKLTLWHKRKENRLIDGHYHAKEPFPTPWDFFRSEINLRVFNQIETIDTETGEVLWEVVDIEHRDELIDKIREKLPDRPAALSQHAFVQPMFVSRKVQKRISGQGHLETLYSEKSTHKNKPQSGIHLRGGIVANATMIRIDVFRHKKTHKNYIVPIYAHQATNGVLPNRAIVSGKDKDTGKKKEWLEMTDEYEFIYSFYPFDLIEIRDKKNPEKRIFGYYRQCNIATGGVDIQQPEDDWTRIKHYQNKFGRQRKSSDNEPDTTAKDEKQTTLFQGVGIQNMEVTKYAVDVLGRKITPIAPEERQGFDELFHDDE